MPEIQEAKSPISFEQILGWMGHLTPQLKLSLMMLARKSPPSVLEEKMKTILRLFRVYLVEFGKLEPGAERARTVLRLMDQELKQDARAEITCSRGCSACCKTYPKQITDDEAALLAEKIKAGTEIDWQMLDEQIQNLKNEKSAAAQKMGCLFLGDDGACRVYVDRPAVCRKYHVTSPPEFCTTDNGPVVPEVSLMSELVASAAMSVPGNDYGWMPVKIAEHLSKGTSKVG